MATQKDKQSLAAMVREEDLDDLKELQNELQGRIDAAHSDGRIYMMQQYTQMLALVTTEVKRIQARFHRETLAGHRKAIKELKETQKQQRDNT